MQIIKKTVQSKRRIIIGISGATGIVYGIRLLEVLKKHAVETHLVVCKAGEMTRAYETRLSSKELRDKADVCYHVNDIAAAIASGSFKTIGMIVAPCSIRTLSEIAAGTTQNLLTRAADVVLKERRRPVLMVRETPLHAGHLKSMLQITESGGIIAPPVPAFYMGATTIEAMVDHTVGRVLDLFDIEMEEMQRWGEPKKQNHANN